MSEQRESISRGVGYVNIIQPELRPETVAFYRAMFNGEMPTHDELAMFFMTPGTGGSMTMERYDRLVYAHRAAQHHVELSSKL